MTQPRPNKNAPDDALDEANAARRIGIDIPTLRRLRFHRIGPEVAKIDGRVWYPERALDRWLAELKRPTPAHFATQVADSSFSFFGD